MNLILKNFPICLPTATYIAAYSRSSFLLKNLVRFINFLYLCFFILSFLCLLTLIARQTSLELPSPGRFMRWDFSQANRRLYMRVKKGWYGGGQRDGVFWLGPSSMNNGSDGDSSRKGEAMRWYVIWPSGCVRSTTVMRVEKVFCFVFRVAFPAIDGSVTGAGGGGGTKGRKCLANSSMLIWRVWGWEGSLSTGGLVTRPRISFSESAPKGPCWVWWCPDAVAFSKVSTAEEMV